MIGPTACIRACPMEHYFPGTTDGNDTCPVCHLPGTSRYGIRAGDSHRLRRTP